MDELKINDVVELKKKHPCKEGSKLFKLLSNDGEVRLKCMACGNVIILKKPVFIEAFKRKIYD